MVKRKKPLILRDSTLREGLETPQAHLGKSEKLRVFKSLVNLGVSAFEIVGPGAFEEGLEFLSCLDCSKPIIKSAIVSVFCPTFNSRIAKLIASGANHIDLLLHVSDIRLRANFPENSKARTKKIIEYLESAIVEVKRLECDSLGIGFGDVFRATPEFVCSLVERLSESYADNFILYDTVGVAFPLQVSSLVRRLLQITAIPLYCHFHNDLGMATANTVTAIENGVSGVDVTIGGLGDRSGNACLEEVALVAEQYLGRKTGVKLARLTETSRAILEIFGILDKRLRPIVGDFAFVHSAHSHFEAILARQSCAY